MRIRAHFFYVWMLAAMGWGSDAYAGFSLSRCKDKAKMEYLFSVFKDVEEWGADCEQRSQAAARAGNPRFKCKIPTKQIAAYERSAKKRMVREQNGCREVCNNNFATCER